MNIEHVVQVHYDDGFPYSESHFIKIDSELILIGCNDTIQKGSRYGEIADTIVKAVNQYEGEKK